MFGGSFLINRTPQSDYAVSALCFIFIFLARPPALYDTKHCSCCQVGGRSRSLLLPGRHHGAPGDGGGEGDLPGGQDREGCEEGHGGHYGGSAEAGGPADGEARRLLRLRGDGVPAEGDEEGKERLRLSDQDQRHRFRASEQRGHQGGQTRGGHSER